MRIEKTVLLPADASSVWDALTNPQLTKMYLFDCEAISDWKAGSEIVFQTDSDGQKTIWDHVLAGLTSLLQNLNAT